MYKVQKILLTLLPGGHGLHSDENTCKIANWFALYQLVFLNL